MRVKITYLSRAKATEIKASAPDKVKYFPADDGQCYDVEADIDYLCMHAGRITIGKVDLRFGDYGNITIY